jgi:hypothetical protein
VDLPVTITIATPEQLEGVRAALERGYDSVRADFADGSGNASPQQDGVYAAMRQVGLQ